jgi:serine/threonine protein kinase
MDLKGKNLTGYYTIREKRGEDLFSEIWEVKPIFSALELYGFFFKKENTDFQMATTKKLQAYLRETFNLQHPNLVNVFESDTFEGKVYVLTEKVQGFRLADYLASKDAFTLGESLSIVYELLNALVYLHRRGLAQNLVNPQTVWIAPHQPFLNRIRIACLGYQFAMGETFLKTESGYSSVAAYLAPEVRKSSEKTVDFQSDLYGVGVIFFRLLTGELPEKIGDLERQPMPVKQADKILREKGVPRDVRRLVVLLMKIRLSGRAHSAESMTEAILSAIRRYTFREHGEVDKKAYLAEMSRKDPQNANDVGLEWNPFSVFGSRTPETREAEGDAYRERNLYFIKLVEEFVKSKNRSSLEWKQDSFPSETEKTELLAPQDFVDEIRMVPDSVLEETLTAASPPESEEDFEWLPVVEEPKDSPGTEPTKPSSGWGLLFRFLKEYWRKVFGGKDLRKN